METKLTAPNVPGYATKLVIKNNLTGKKFTKGFTTIRSLRFLNWYLINWFQTNFRELPTEGFTKLVKRSEIKKGIKYSFNVYGYLILIEPITKEELIELRKKQ